MPSARAWLMSPSISAAALLVAACAASPEPFDATGHAAGSQSEALLTDSPRCDLESLTSTITRACSDLYYNAVSLQPPAATALFGIETSSSYSLRLRADGPGRVEFIPPVPGDYAFYWGTPNVPFLVGSEDGRSVPATCSRYLSDAVKDALSAGDCARRKGVYIFRLEANHTYTIDVGPLPPPHAFVTLRIEVARVSRPVSQLDCANRLDESIGAQLQTLCALGGTEVPLDGRPFTSALGARLEPSVAYGVHLGGNREAALEFLPPKTGDYLVGLGTRADTLKLSMRMSTATQTAACTPGPDLLSYSLPEGCAFRGFTKVSLREGELLRLELSGSDSLRWVRTAIIPYEPAPPVCSDLRLLFLSARYARPEDNTPMLVSASDLESWLAGLKSSAVSARLGLATFSSEADVVDANPRLLSSIPLTSEEGLLASGVTGSTSSLLPLWLVALRPRDYGFGPEGGYVVMHAANQLPADPSPCTDCRGIELECARQPPMCEEGNCDDQDGEVCWPVTPCPACYPNDGDGTPPEPGEAQPTIAQLRAALEKANLVPVVLASDGRFLPPPSAYQQWLTSELGRGKVVSYSTREFNETDYYGDHKHLGQYLNELVLPQLTETCSLGD